MGDCFKFLWPFQNIRTLTYCLTMKSQFFIYNNNDKRPETGSDSLLCVSICNTEYVRAVGVGTGGQDFDNQLTLSQPGGADNAHQINT